MNDAKTLHANAGATNTANIAFGGSPPNYKALTELWNGSSWTEVDDLNQGRQLLAGAGTSTSGLGFGGEYSTPSLSGLTESWNGSSWTEVSDFKHC